VPLQLVDMAEGDWDEVTIIRKRAPKAGQLKTPQVTDVIISVMFTLCCTGNCDKVHSTGCSRNTTSRDKQLALKKAEALILSLSYSKFNK